MAALKLDEIGILMQDSPSGKFYYINGAGQFQEFVIPQSSQVGYSSYVASLTQSGTTAPSASVLSNDLTGTPIWTRNVAGSYTCTLNGVFEIGKTEIIFLHTVYSTSADDFALIKLVHASDNQFQILVSDSADVSQDGYLTNFTIRINVFP